MNGILQTYWFHFDPRISGRQTHVFALAVTLLSLGESFHWLSLILCNLYGPHDNFDLNTAHVLPALVHKVEIAKSKLPFSLASFLLPCGLSKHQLNGLADPQAARIQAAVNDICGVFIFVLYKVVR